MLRTIPAIRDVIDVNQGTLSGISGPVYDAFNCLGISLVSLAAAIPPEALADFEDSIRAPRDSVCAGDGLAAGHNPS